MFCGHIAIALKRQQPVLESALQVRSMPLAHSIWPSVHCAGQQLPVIAEHIPAPHGLGSHIDCVQLSGALPRW
jgi:hypothetical protein